MLLHCDNDAMSFSLLMNNNDGSWTEDAAARGVDVPNTVAGKLIK